MVAYVAKHCTHDSKLVTWRGRRREPRYKCALLSALCPLPCSRRCISMLSGRSSNISTNSSDWILATNFAGSGANTSPRENRRVSTEPRCEMMDSSAAVASWKWEYPESPRSAIPAPVLPPLGVHPSLSITKEQDVSRANDKRRVRTAWRRAVLCEGLTERNG